MTVSNGSCITLVEVSRGSTHDGPGLRTTVFTKGCPLACRWCQNPESLSFKQEIWYEASKCIGCLFCLDVCPNATLETSEKGIRIDRDKCRGCGACAAGCPAKALMTTGTDWTLDELVHEVMKDKPYYDEFGGGVTVSGGEPLMHADFLVAFYKILKADGIHAALDTCGCLPEETIMKTIPYVDAILYDIKLFDAEKHKNMTGWDNKNILDNLKAISAYIRKTQNRGIQLWIRTPLIPGVTSTRENITQIADFIAEHISDVFERWELCTFNPACAAKYVKMQKPWPYEGTVMMKQIDIDRIKEAALSRGISNEKLIVTGLIKQE